MQAFNNSNNSNNVAWERSQRMLAKWSGVGHTGRCVQSVGQQTADMVMWPAQFFLPISITLIQTYQHIHKQNVAHDSCKNVTVDQRAMVLKLVARSLGRSKLWHQHTFGSAVGHKVVYNFFYFLFFFCFSKFYFLRSKHYNFDLTVLVVVVVVLLVLLVLSLQFLFM